RPAHGLRERSAAHGDTASALSRSSWPPSSLTFGNETVTCFWRRPSPAIKRRNGVVGLEASQRTCAKFRIREDVIDIADIAVIELLVIVVFDLHDLVAGRECPSEPLHFAVTSGIERGL